MWKLDFCTASVFFLQTGWWETQNETSEFAKHEELGKTLSCLHWTRISPAVNSLNNWVFGIEKRKNLMHWLSLLYSGQLLLTCISRQMLFCSRSPRNQTVGRNHHTWHLWFYPPVQNHPVRLNRHLLRKSIAAYYLNGHCFLCGLIIVRREGKVIRKVERELYSTLYSRTSMCDHLS